MVLWWWAPRAVYMQAAPFVERLWSVVVKVSHARKHIVVCSL